MPRTLNLDVLDEMRVASPCPMEWDQMVGDEKRRFCEHCGLHVHNVAAMTREETLGMLRQAMGGGRVCARLYRRADGTVLTRDCPVGLAAVRARVRRTWGRVAAAVGLLFSGIWVFARGDRPDFRLADAQPFATVRSWLGGPPPRGQTMVAGAICLPPEMEAKLEKLIERELAEREASGSH